MKKRSGLTDSFLRQLKPENEALVGKKYSDSGGLYIVLSRSGSRLWRLKYRYDRKEKLLALGAYPEVSLGRARDLREAAKELLRNHKDPALHKLEVKDAEKERVANTFKVVALEWHAVKHASWTKVHSEDVLGSLKRLVFPKLGNRPISEIKASDVLEVLREIEARPAVETARRVRQRVSAVFVYAMASGKGVDTDPASVVRPALAPVVRRQQPALITLPAVRDMLLKVEALPGHPVTRLALRLLALTAVRPGVINGLPWSELKNIGHSDVWAIPAERMKTKREFLVPLSRQAIETIQVIHTITGDFKYVFPNRSSAQKPMSENAVRYMLNRAGFAGEHVPHGWRAAFSTIMNGQFPADRQIIDLMLAHVSENAVEGAYNREAYLGRRRELAQEWADMLLKDFQGPSELIEGRRKGETSFLSGA